MSEVRGSPGKLLGRGRPHGRAAPPRPRRCGARGFSLLEVVVGLALLAAVLTSISAAFLIGGRVISSARETSTATMLASGIVAEMQRWTFAECYTRLEGDAGAGSVRADSRINAGAGAWQANLASSLKEGRAIVTVEALGASTLGSAIGLRLTVVVEWTRGERTRRITLVRVRI